MKTEAEVKVENKMLASMILAQHQLATMVHAGWTEFSDEAKSLETKIHTLWRESGREDAPTYDLCIWAQAQGKDFTNPLNAGN